MEEVIIGSVTIGPTPYQTAQIRQRYGPVPGLSTSGTSEGGPVVVTVDLALCEFVDGGGTQFWVRIVMDNNHSDFLVHTNSSSSGDYEQVDPVPIQWTTDPPAGPHSITVQWKSTGAFSLMRAIGGGSTMVVTELRGG